MKPLVIYHADCTDGFGAAFCAWLRLGDTATYLPMQYGQVKTTADLAKILNGVGLHCRGKGEVYILDFSFPKEIMEWLLAAVGKVVWLDHHKTAFESWIGSHVPGGAYFDLTGSRHLLLDDTRSGALLAWDYFYPNLKAPAIIRHIDDRDRWQFKMDRTKEIHAALVASKPWSFEQWRSDFFLLEDAPAGGGSDYYFNRYLDFVKEGRAVLRAQDLLVEQMAKQAQGCCIDLNVSTSRFVTEYEQKLVGPTGLATTGGLAVNASVHQSELGHVLATESGTYGLIWYLDSNGRANCSLRSNGNYDVSAIAKAFGGGGHMNAAGFSVGIATLLSWLQ